MCGNSVVFCYYDGPAWKVRENAGYKDVVRAAANEIISVAAANEVKLPENSAVYALKTLRSLRQRR